ncbi:MAG: hypothetical protein P4L10_02430 [Acidobacteriaceae bacterium]|nr:hypothetical protein [Acidobacteriaceae bacterium]
MTSTITPDVIPFPSRSRVRSIEDSYTNTAGLKRSQQNTPYSSDIPVMGVAGTSALKSHPISIDVLYGSIENGAKHPLEALNSLAQVIGLLELAKDASAESVLKSDAIMQEFQLALRQLFKFRQNLGDGYGLVVNCTEVALINQRGVPLSSSQISSVWRAFRALRETPFLSFDRALDLVEDVEAEGLETDPHGIGDLLGAE